MPASLSDVSDTAPCALAAIETSTALASLASAKIWAGTRPHPASCNSSGIRHRSWLPSSWRRRGDTWTTAPRRSASLCLTRCLLTSSTRSPPSLFILRPHGPFSTAATATAGSELSGHQRLQGANLLLSRVRDAVLKSADCEIITWCSPSKARCTAFPLRRPGG